ncbi:MAG: ribonuclease P protein component [Candidatus Zambryskibacteria bacterium]|nr:ribonuclease P protein component [Candidatus Zambryskibacteria bacterium]
MLPKKNRISRREIEVILKNGSRYNSPNLLMYLYKNGKEKKLQNSQFSFSISKKISKNAVDRNKQRRRGYSVINKHIDKIKDGYYCMFVFKKGSGSIKYENLEKEILELLSESNVFYPHTK